MDRFVNKKIEKQTIYEIYRACRLCGAGGGYKMPIIQNVVNLDGDVELKQKIRECVQIEVHQDDKMPPLICELCVDKVNDFYEFLEMCRQTNKRTRLRLGLPPQMLPRGAPDAGDCILGVTEPIYVNDDSNEPLSKQKSKTPKLKVKAEPEKQLRVKIENNMREPRTAATPRTTRHRPPTPPRPKRGGDVINETSSQIQSRSKNSVTNPPKSILKKEIKEEETSSRLKRGREKETKPAVPNKKVKISLSNVPTRSKTRSAPAPESKQAVSKPTPSQFVCSICKQRFKTVQAMKSHAKTHALGSTPRPPPKERVTGVECEVCWKMIPSHLMATHRCPGGKCSKCSKSYATVKSLRKHESTCRRDKLNVDPKVMNQLRPLQIRVAKCDPLLAKVKEDHYDVSCVVMEYGLDRNCYYPYSGLRIKTEPADFMVSINHDLDFPDFVHWDSDLSSDTDDEDDLFARRRQVESLTALALRTIFSPQCLGKVPRKRRRVKQENLNSIISGLETDIACDGNGGGDVGVNLSGDDDDMFPKNDVAAVTNDDFDRIFSCNDTCDNYDKLGLVKDSGNSNVNASHVVSNVGEKVINDNNDGFDGTNDVCVDTELRNKNGGISGRYYGNDPANPSTEGSKLKDDSENLSNSDSNDAREKETDASREMQPDTSSDSKLNVPSKDLSKLDNENIVEDIAKDSNRDFNKTYADNVLASATDVRIEGCGKARMGEGDKTGEDVSWNGDVNAGHKLSDTESNIVASDISQVGNDRSFDKRNAKTAIADDDKTSDTFVSIVNKVRSDENPAEAIENAAVGVRKTADADVSTLNGVLAEDVNLDMDDLEDYDDTEDDNLIKAIDAQIAGKETAKSVIECDKITLEDLLPKESGKSLALDSISDEDFKFQD